jgi:hypothetical protein
MISLNAKQSLNLMVRRAILTSPLMGNGIFSEVLDLPDLSHLGTDHVVMLTVSAYQFRLIMLIHYSPDAKTYAHFAAVNKLAPAEMGEQAFVDAICECANMCCGNLNRDLARVFKHVGMSTPNIIDRRCVDYLNQLGKGHQLHYGLQQTGGPDFGVTVCLDAFAPLDFAFEVEEAEETGELEMF